jgi:hypothetical protein
MTENEIVKSYKQATKKVQQIGILADLNLCSKKEIRDLLEQNGCDVPRYKNRYTKVEPDTQTDKPDFPEPVIALVKKRILEIDLEMKPLESRLESLSIEYNTLKNWMDLVEKIAE